MKSMSLRDPLVENRDTKIYNRFTTIEVLGMEVGP